MGCGVGSACAAYATAPHPAVGMGDPTALHASGYAHPAMGVGALITSCASAQPPSTLAVAAVYDDGGGSETTLAVGVYCGRSVSDAAFTFASVVGGHTLYVASEDAAIVPAPGPPVCHAANELFHGTGLTPSAPHVPAASRGSVGIQPCSRPSWYDHSGDSTMLLVDELPICIPGQ